MNAYVDLPPARQRARSGPFTCGTFSVRAMVTIVQCEGRWFGEFEESAHPTTTTCIQFGSIQAFPGTLLRTTTRSS